MNRLDLQCSLQVEIFAAAAVAVEAAAAVQGSSFQMMISVDHQRST